MKPLPLTRVLLLEAPLDQIYSLAEISPELAAAEAKQRSPGGVAVYLLEVLDSASEALTESQRDADEMAARTRALLRRKKPRALRLIKFVSGTLFGSANLTPEQIEHERVLLLAARDTQRQIQESTE